MVLINICVALFTCALWVQDKRTPLHWAAEAGDVQMVTALCKDRPWVEKPGYVDAFSKVTDHQAGQSEAY